MSIQAISTRLSLPVTGSQPLRPSSSGMPASDAVAATEVTISQAARALAAAETTSADTYDFSKMSPQDLLQTMNGLIKSGKLSVDETSSLVALIPTALSKVAYDGEAPAAFYEPSNFFDKLEQAIAYDKYSHNDQGVIYAQKALAALLRFQGTAVAG